MTSSAELTRSCPLCGQPLADSEKTCARCGIDVPSGAKKPGKAKGASGKATKVECPHCGELVSKRAKKCPACRTSLPSGFYKDSPKPAVDKEIREQEQVPVEQVLHAAADEVRSCGTDGLTHGGIAIRENPPPTVVGEVEKTDSVAAQADATPVGGTAEPIPSSVERAEPLAVVEPAPAEGLDMKIENLVSASEHVPPAVTTLTVDMSVTNDAVAGITQPSPPSNPQPLEELPSAIVEHNVTVSIPTQFDPQPNVLCVSVGDDKTSEDDIAVTEPVIAQAPPAVVTDKVEDDAETCKVCEAIVPMSAQESLTDFLAALEKAHIADHVQLVAEPPNPEVQAVSDSPNADAVPKPQKLIRKRRLKSAKSTATATVTPQ